MSQAVGSQALGNIKVGEHSYSGLWKLRVVPGWIVLFAAVVNLYALSWDIQWHSAVGRDRTLTTPHLFILGSIALMGLAALAAVLIETRGARRSSPLLRGGTSFAGFFSSSLGAYLVGYGALDAAIAFPIDQYWHTLYGIDVAIWAPFHIMAVTGICICTLGVVMMLAEGANLARQEGAKWTARAGYLGAIVGLAALMGFLSVLLPDSLKRSEFIAPGGLAFTVFPLMFYTFGMLVLTIALRALPWRAVATSVAVVYAVFGLLNFVIIPSLTTWLLGIEQQSLRPRAPTVSVLGVEWEYGLIVAAILLDIGVWIAQRREWTLKRINLLMLAIGAVGMSIATLLFPMFSSAVQSYINSPVLQLDASAPQHPNFVLIVVISLLLGLPGVYTGNWFGTIAGNVMGRKKQA